MPEAESPAGMAPLHDRLAWLDQLAFELHRATGRSQLMQCLWLYGRPLNEDALQKTVARLAALPFNRLIEPSPVPGGRPRWVKPAGALVPVESGAGIMERSQLLTWANSQARLAIDPVRGPAWRVAIQRFGDGTTAVSIVGSHLVVDGMGGLTAIAAAAKGVAVPNFYLPQCARGWLAACLADLRQILADTPRTLAALAGIARQLRPWAGPRKTRAAEETSGGPEAVDLPAIAVTIDAGAWDACAKRLGGHPVTLLPGVVAVLAAELGRRRASDGAVSLIVPLDTRSGLDDSRALAIAFHTMTLSPEGLSASLDPVNAPLKALLRRARAKQSGGLEALLPAIAWMPRTIATALVNSMFSYAGDLPVSCSNLGTLPAGLDAIDGAPCTLVLPRAVDVNVTRRDLRRSHGHLVAVTARHGASVTLCIEARQLEPAQTTAAQLRDAMEHTLAAFGLSASIEL